MFFWWGRYGSTPAPPGEFSWWGLFFACPEKARMKIITITREYGAGGGEVARKLAETLGWELLDRELLHQAAAVEHVPDAELERLDEKALTMADRSSSKPLSGSLKRGRPAARLFALPTSGYRTNG